MMAIFAPQLAILLIITSIKIIYSGSSCPLCSIASFKEIVKNGCECKCPINERNSVILECIDDNRRILKSKRNEIVPDEETLIRTIEKLQMIKLKATNLLRVLKQLTKVENYNLTHLEIRETNEVKKVHLEELWTLTSLETLSLESLNLKELPTEGLNNLLNLKQLHIRHNRLTFLNGSVQLPNLVMFNADSNAIRKVSDDYFEKIPNLQTLDLSNNMIEVLNSNFCAQTLITLVLNNNNVSNIHGSFARRCEMISVLSLTNNNLEVIDDGSFPNSLTTLDLSNNRKTIKSFPRNAFESDIPNEINLKDDIFICSCELQWIKDNCDNLVNLNTLKCENGTIKKPLIQVEFCDITRPSTEKTTSPSTEKTTSPSTESTTSLSTESTTSLSTESTTSLSTESTTSLSTESTTSPSTESTTSPSTESTTSPSTESTTSPSTESTTSPSTKSTTSPSTKGTTSPSTKSTTSPSTKSTKSPSTKSTTSPSTKSTTSPSTKGTTSPSTKSTTSPSTKSTKSPSTKSTTSPSTKSTTSPSTESTTSPSTESTTSPSTERTTSSSTERNTSPSTESTSSDIPNTSIEITTLSDNVTSFETEDSSPPTTAGTTSSSKVASVETEVSNPTITETSNILTSPKPTDSAITEYPVENCGRKFQKIIEELNFHIDSVNSSEGNCILPQYTFSWNGTEMAKRNELITVKHQIHENNSYSYEMFYTVDPSQGYYTYSFPENETMSRTICIDLLEEDILNKNCVVALAPPMPPSKQIIEKGKQAWSSITYVVIGTSLVTALIVAMIYNIMKKSVGKNTPDTPLRRFSIESNSTYVSSSNLPRGSFLVQTKKSPVKDGGYVTIIDINHTYETIRSGKFGRTTIWNIESEFDKRVFLEKLLNGITEPTETKKQRNGTSLKGLRRETAKSLLPKRSSF